MKPQSRIGLASLTRMSFEGKNLSSLNSQLIIDNSEDSNNVGPLMDVSAIEQLKGNMQAGLDWQLQAFHRCRLFRTYRQEPGKRTVLVLAAPIHMGGNTPIEFLLEGSEFEIITYYVIPGMPIENPIPEHDVSFVAAPGDSGVTRRFIESIQDLIEYWPTPIINLPENILKLERDVLQGFSQSIGGIRFPKTIRYGREKLIAVAENQFDSEFLDKICSYPLVIRPVGSHAGRGLKKLNSVADIAHYLQQWQDEEFFLSEFVDYSSIDGFYRKYRIVFIDGVPYPCHMAISDQWKVWYMNSQMGKSDQKKKEEEVFMDQFQEGFATRHKDSLATLCQRIGLEYFGIDCAEDKNGQLVLFEADNALIVHDMDSQTVFPYKTKHMNALFGAFADMMEDKCLTSSEILKPKPRRIVSDMHLLDSMV